MSKLKSLIVIIILALLVWLLVPVYGFYAHKGDLPYWQDATFHLPESLPQQQTTYLVQYANSAKQAMALLHQQQQRINSPAISAAVAIDGQLIWAGASGYADLACQCSATTATQFRIGSTSKALTATALAQLVADKMIDLDAPLSYYFNPIANPAWQSVTARQLASHTSGLPHYKNNTDLIGLYKSIALNEQFDDVTDALELFDSSELLFKPGTQFSYSSYGTVLLSALMQQVSGSTYLDVMQQRVFSPLLMDATQAESQSNKTPNQATFYWQNASQSHLLRPWRSVNLSHRLAAGGFLSTPSDLVKLGSAYLNPHYLSDEIKSLFWTPQKLANGQVNEQNYALGWRVGEAALAAPLGKTKFIHRGGVSRGSQSLLIVLPKYKTAIAININTNTEVFWDFGKISLQLAEIFLNNHSAAIN